jgi:hypothetical protein
MKTLKTLVSDVYNLFNPKVPVIPKEEHLNEFADNLKKMLVTRLDENKHPPGLRMSNIGKVCSRELWYSANKPEAAEIMQPSTYIKFLFGDIIEHLLIFLIKTAGHTVTNEQEELTVQGVKGHIDGVVDGVLCDVKSASSFAFQKFEEGLAPEKDSFGYRTQLGIYKYAKFGKTKDPAAFIAFDKQLGKIVVDVHNDLNDVDYERLVVERKMLMGLPNPPERAFEDEVDGKSGNRKLGTNCGYCAFKKTCWPGLRTFAYASKPTYLTNVVRLPNVPELR